MCLAGGCQKYLLFQQSPTLDRTEQKRSLPAATNSLRASSSSSSGSAGGVSRICSLLPLRDRTETLFVHA